MDSSKQLSPQRSIRRRRVRRILRHAAGFKSGFTLTEILIALAITSLLLVGISRIFALTSQTIGTGQALSKAVRTQKSIGQALSNDFLGTGAQLDNPDYQSGILPIVPKSGSDDAMPFLTISNFRVPAYQNQAAYTAAVGAPADTTKSFLSRSAPTRSIDADNDGTLDDTTRSLSQGGGVYSLFIYGTRNFRCDTLSFFTRGKFLSQTGTGPITKASDFQSGATATDAWVFYGHARVFNGDISRIDVSGGYGAPGMWETPVRDYVGAQNFAPTGDNKNNRFADQFILARSTLLMNDMIDHDGLRGTSPTVVANGDPGKPVMFVSRNWDDAYDWADGRQVTPFNLDSSIRFYIRPGSPLSGTADAMDHNETVQVTTEVCPAPGGSNIYEFRDGRTDMGCTGIALTRARARAVQEYDADPAGAAGRFPSNTQVTYTGGSNPWWRYLPVGWNQRFNVNPFPAMSATNGFSPKSLAQRQQILSPGVSQFIVEYAGDFIRQDPQTGEVVSNEDAMRPDGVTDFVIVNGRRQTRWYGLPRDVNGDGIIAGTDQSGTIVQRPIQVVGSSYYLTQAQILAQLQRPTGTSEQRMRTSPDVVPLRDVCGYFHPFEKAAPLPPASGFYDQVIDEPSTVPNPSIDSANPSPEGTGYICVWAPLEMDQPVAGLTPGPVGGAQPVSVYAVPQQIRVIVSVSDDQSKLNEPVTEEYVFPVRLKN